MVHHRHPRQVDSPGPLVAAPLGVTTKVYGLDELARGMRDLAGEIDTAAENELETVAAQTAAEIRGKVPRLTGRLAGSVTSSGGLFSSAATVSMGGLPYAGWIEFGGSRGRPFVADGRFVLPTAEDNEGLAERAGEKAARNQIRRQRWPRPNRL